MQNREYPYLHEHWGLYPRFVAERAEDGQPARRAGGVVETAPAQRHPPQGCSTLWDNEKSEQIVDAGEGGAVAVLAERAAAVGLEDVEGETAQAGEHAGIGADARAVFAKGDIAAVVRGGLDPPMRAHRRSGAGGGERGIGDVEGGLGGVAQQPGPGIAGEDIALDPDDGGDVGVPVGVGEFVGGIKDADGAGFVAVATLVAALG